MFCWRIGNEDVLVFAEQNAVQASERRIERVYRNVRELRGMYRSKTKPLRLVTPLPSVTLVNPEQPWNAPSSMLVTLSGITTLFNSVQSSNARGAMLVTLLGTK